MNAAPVEFRANGALQSYVIPLTSNYLIEAAGAQGGPTGVLGGGQGGKGARLRGTFFLKAGDVLHILVGKRGGAGTIPETASGGGGGGTFVWRGVLPAPLPARPLLAAAGGGGGNGGPGLVDSGGGQGAAPGGSDGQGGHADMRPLQFGGGGGAGWLSGGASGGAPSFCGGGTLWHGGTCQSLCHGCGGTGGFGGGGGGSFVGQGGGGGGGYSGGGGGAQYGPPAGGGGSFNGGLFQSNAAGVQIGDGGVFISRVLATDPAHPRPNPLEFTAYLPLRDLHAQDHAADYAFAVRRFM
jgi:hypothetical protein